VNQSDSLPGGINASSKLFPPPKASVKGLTNRRIHIRSPKRGRGTSWLQRHPQRRGGPSTGERKSVKSPFQSFALHIFPMDNWTTEKRDPYNMTPPQSTSTEHEKPVPEGMPQIYSHRLIEAMTPSPSKSICIPTEPSGCLLNKSLPLQTSLQIHLRKTTSTHRSSELTV
jgi:hypothetical protein